MEAEGWSFEPGTQVDIGKQTRRFFRLRGECAVVDGRIVGHIPEDGEDMALWKNQVGRWAEGGEPMPRPTLNPNPDPDLNPTLAPPPPPLPSTPRPKPSLPYPSMMLTAPSKILSSTSLIMH